MPVEYTHSLSVTGSVDTAILHLTVIRDWQKHSASDLAIVHAFTMIDTDQSCGRLLPKTSIASLMRDFGSLYEQPRGDFPLSQK